MVGLFSNCAGYLHAITLLPLLWLGPFVSSGDDVIKSFRFTIVMSASLMSGSACPRTCIIFFLLTGEARLCVMSTNNLPPALRMGAFVVNRKKDNPNGLMGSVIIC